MVQCQKMQFPNDSGVALRSPLTFFSPRPQRSLTPQSNTKSYSRPREGAKPIAANQTARRAKPRNESEKLLMFKEKVKIRMTQKRKMKEHKNP